MIVSGRLTDYSSDTEQLKEDISRKVNDKVKIKKKGSENF